ncbi:hypothetical protein Leryth_001790 [Lithospermum erythrorhizon]|nr:hypothetical protein Leryth_001790 [Lithospermum erythrorhizon]
MEELQSRIVVAENLPDDHCHQNLMRIFSAVGSVKAIRTCQPSASNGVVSSASRTANSDVLRQSNKLHAFVEYESLELAEKAVAQLTDKKNWRNGLKVRFLIKSQVKSSPARSLKAGHDNGSGGISPTESEGDDEGEQKKPRGRGWGKGRPQYQPPNSRGSIMGCPQNAHIASNNEQHATIKQAHVPRMPDGTRGFSMGRGKMIAARTA